MLEPTADGFRNYLVDGHLRPAEKLLVDRANMLMLTAPEMTVLVGGMRVLDAEDGGIVGGIVRDQQIAVLCSSQYLMRNYGEAADQDEVRSGVGESADHGS